MSLNPIERSQGLRIRSTQDLGAGLFMIALAALAYFLARDLPMGTLRQIGPGMLPKSFAVICAGLGALVIMSALVYSDSARRLLIFVFLGLGALLGLGSVLLTGPLFATLSLICFAMSALIYMQSGGPDGERLEGWSWRGVIFVLGGAVLFGLTIRGFEIGPLKIPQLGMVVSGPLVVLVAGLAATDMRWKELVIFAVVMTTFCALLFKYALGLPIPLAPWLLGI